MGFQQLEVSRDPTTRRLRVRLADGSAFDQGRAQGNSWLSDDTRAFP